MSVDKVSYKAGNTGYLGGYKPSSESGHSLLKRDSMLTVSATALSFVQTTANKPSFLILTVKQQGINDPVTLTTDAPEYFQLAADSRPAFLPNLTLIPAAEGTYVHVRYFSIAVVGSHTGQLIIQNGRETITVTLEGKKTGLPSVLQNNWPNIRRTMGETWYQQPMTTKYLIPFFVLPVLIGIAYAAVTSRSQTTTELHHTTDEVRRINRRNTVLTSTVAPKELSAKTSKKDPLIALKRNREVAVPAVGKPASLIPSTPSSSVESSVKYSQTNTTDQTIESVAARGKPADQPTTDTQKRDRQGTKKQRQNPDRSVLATKYDTSVSELERVLNHP